MVQDLAIFYLSNVSFGMCAFSDKFLVFMVDTVWPHLNPYQLLPYGDISLMKVSTDSKLSHSLTVDDIRLIPFQFKMA
jgi:hypothetical protein